MIPEKWLPFAWYMIYILVAFGFALPASKQHNGYCWRFLRRHVWPFNRCPDLNPFHAIYRSMTMLGVLFVPSIWTPERWIGVTFWLPLIVLILDDYFNGDDDERKKRWESVKNKIRWAKLKPAPQPIRARI